MAQTVHLFTGMTKWAKVYKPDEKYGKYSLNFYPKDDADRKAIKATGIKNNTKEDDDGFYYVFRSEKAPTVVDNKGEEFDQIIGNGSTITVKLGVESFTSAKWGKVVRSTLLGVKVEELVEYVPDNRDDDEASETPKMPF